MNFFVKKIQTLTTSKRSGVARRLRKNLVPDMAELLLDPKVGSEHGINLLVHPKSLCRCKPWHYVAAAGFEGLTRHGGGLLLVDAKTQPHNLFPLLIPKVRKLNG